ncbi:MAG: amidase [Ilumatobacteraceae bacterium]
MNPIALSAAELSSAIHDRQFSCREVMAAHLDRIDERNPRHNAIVSLRDREALMAEAGQCDDELAAGLSRGWMHGLPVAVKDLAETQGLRTTSGSRLLADHVPTADCLMVQRMRAAGCIVIGKTNVPEFGLGSHTYNDVFGTTGNAYDPSRSAGGSSGGACVALATRMVPIADGSDYMGSLRNPAAWNNVIGLRPSQGRVPGWPTTDAYMSQMSTEGPMARRVLDVAMLLATQSGPHPLCPLALDTRLDEFDGIDAASATLAAGTDGRGGIGGLRIGWLGDLGGHLAIESGISDACEAGLRRLESLGCHVEYTALDIDLQRTWQAWQVLRQYSIAGSLGSLIGDPAKASLMKPELRWEIEHGLALGAIDIARAAQQRTAFHAAMVGLFERYDALVMPSAQMWPFDASLHWPDRIGDRSMGTYHQWMEVTSYATFAGLPAASLPVGFSTANSAPGVPAGLPMGMQVIGRPRGDVELLVLAHAYEATIDDLGIGDA